MNKKFMCLAVSAVLVLSAASCGKKASDEGEGSAAVNVTTKQAVIDNVERKVNYNGEISAGDYVSITSKVSAKTENIYVDEGDYVEAGAVLAVLDSTDLRLSYNQALASYNSAQASYDMTANASVKQAETSVNQALERAEIEYNDAVNAYNRQKELYDNDSSTIAAQNALNDAQSNLERTRQLFEMGAVSQVEYDNAVTSEQNARANLDSVVSSAKTALDTAKTRMENAELSLSSARENRDLQVGVTGKKTIASAKAAAESAKAALAIAENNLSNTKIIAPIAGYVASKNIEKGQMATPGVEIFSIKNTGYVDAEINVTESDIPYVAVGIPAEVTVKSADSTVISGTVSAVNPTKNEQTGLYSVKVSIPNEDGKIKAGMFADISLTLEISEQTVSVPTEAIMQDGDEYYVFAASADGKTAEKKVVKKGIENAEFTEIKSGVEAGDKIILKGKEYLSEKNNKIKITE